VTDGASVSRGSLSEVTRHRRVRGVCRQLPRLPSWGCTLPQRVAARCRQRVMGSALPPRPFERRGGVQRRRRFGSVDPTFVDLEVFTTSPAAGRRNDPRSALGVTPPPGYDRRARHAPPRRCRGARVRVVPPAGFGPLQHRKSAASTNMARVCLTRIRSVFRVSHPPDGLLRRAPSGLVSSR
jgi:hypothetical protein